MEALGSGIGVRSAVLVGGIDMMAQAIAIAKRPHILVGTPGRVVDHLSNTKASLQALPTATARRSRGQGAAQRPLGLTDASARRVRAG